MARIFIACPDCTTDTSMPAWATLGALEGELLGLLGQLSWACLSCGRLVTAEREMAHLLRRITASVSLLVHGLAIGAGDSGLHAAQPGAGPLFTSQDVLTLHELLETDTWIDRFDEPPKGSR